MGCFQDKVAIVTGSSCGIGKELAKQLVLGGAKVLINGRSEHRLQIALQELRELAHSADDIQAFCGDVSVPADCRQMAGLANQMFGGLDMLINNAGVSMEGELARITPEVFEKTVGVNLLGSVYATQAALPLLKRSSGSVMFVSSLAGLYGLPRFSAYSASKMALTSLADSLRIEVHPNGVHVGIAYVSFTENDIQKTILGADGRSVPQPSREGWKQEPVDVVASRILSMIRRRRDRETFTVFGKMTEMFNRLMPRIFQRLLRWKYVQEYGRPKVEIPENIGKRSAA